MGRNKKKTEIPIKIEFTDGYQERFTNAILKIYEKRVIHEDRTSVNKNDKSA